MRAIIMLVCILVSAMSLAQEDLGLKHFRFDEPQDATVLLADGTETSLRLNYNLITEEMILDLGHTKVPYTNTSEIDKVVIAGTTFIHLEDVFYEIIHPGEVELLLRRKRKLLLPGEETGYGRTSATAVSSTQSPVFNPDIVYQQKLPSNYDIEAEDTYFWLIQEELISLKSPKKAIKSLPDVSSDLKNFIKSNQIRGYEEKKLVQLTDYCNQLLSQ